MDYTIFIMIGVIILLAILTALFLFSRYKKCPSDKLLVVYGALKDKTKAAKIYPGGGVFVWPWIQAYSTMSMLPYKITSEIIGPDSGKVRTHVSVALTTGISNDPQIQLNAVNRFLTSDDETIEAQLKLILDGAVRDIIATMDILDLVSDRNKFRAQVFETLKPTLSSIGFELINMNIQGIWDDDKYIENSGKKKVTQAAADADADIADMKKRGAIRKAEIERDEAVSIANAKKQQAVDVATAQKEEQVGVADIEKDQVVALATAMKNKESGKAEQEAEQRAKVASANAQAKIAEAEADSAARAQVAQAGANAEAAEAEAIAGMQVRKAKAAQDQAAQTTQAVQDKEAREAEYKSKKDQRKAMAERDAGVAEQNAKIDVANARAKAGQAEADADKTVRNAQVDAEMSVAENKQVRQLKVNEAEAKATEAKLNATKIIPAQKAKEEAVIAAEKQKAEQVIDAQGYAEATLKKAEVDARAIQLKMEAEAAGIEAKGKAEGAREEAIAVGKARGVQEEALAEAMKIERMIQAAGGDVNALTQLRLTDHVEAGYDAIGNQFNALRDAKITVVGNPSTAGDLIGSLVSKGAPALQLLNDGLKEQVLKTFGLGKKETKELPDGSSK